MLSKTEKGKNRENAGQKRAGIVYTGHQFFMVEQLETQLCSKMIQNLSSFRFGNMKLRKTLRFVNILYKSEIIAQNL